MIHTKHDMKNNEPAKPNIYTRCWSCVRDNCCSAGKVLRNWYCTSLAKTGNKCEEVEPFGHLIALLCLFGIFCIPYGISFGYNHFFSVTEDNLAELEAEVPVNQQTANVVSATTNISIDPPNIDISDAFSECNLGTGKWLRWYGKVNQDFEDKNHFTLPVNSSSVLFKYAGKIEDFSSCEFVFIPRSENSINYVISLDEIYQIVIGDNDFWTVALRATDAIGEDLTPIREVVTQKTRPRLLNKVKNGTTVKVSLNQGFDDVGKYQIELTVNYKPDTIELDEAQTSKFVWMFEPSPAILGNPSLSVGLIRGLGDKSEIGVKFIDPSVVKEEESVFYQESQKN